MPSQAILVVAVTLCAAMLAVELHLLAPLLFRSGSQAMAVSTVTSGW